MPSFLQRPRIQRPILIVFNERLTRIEMTHRVLYWCHRKGKWRVVDDHMVQRCPSSLPKCWSSLCSKQTRWWWTSFLKLLSSCRREPGSQTTSSWRPLRPPVTAVGHGWRPPLPSESAIQLSQYGFTWPINICQRNGYCILACDKMCKMFRRFKYQLDSGSVCPKEARTHFGIDVGPF